MAETALAVLGIIGPTVDAISAAYNVCQKMKDYGRDMYLCWARLDTQWVIFNELMDRRICDHMQFCDWTDENDSTTRAVMEQLNVLEDRFGFCCEIVQKICPGTELGDSSYHRHLLRENALATTSIRSSDLTLQAQNIRTCDVSSLRPSKVQEEASKPIKHSTFLRTPSPDPGKYESLRGCASTWNRLTWAHHGKSQMEAAIASIRVTVSDLKDLLTLREPKEPHKMIPEVETPTASQSRSKEARSIYLDVHRALCEANKRSKRPVSFTICALGELEDNWNKLENVTRLQMRPDCAALWLQMHVNDDEGAFWMAEVRLSENSTMRNDVDLPLIEYLDELPHVDLVKDTREHYEVGALLNKFDPTDKIHVFAHRHPSRKQRTLREVLTEEDSRSRLSDAEIVNLCLAIVVAHNNLTDVRKTTMSTSLDSYVFYQENSDLNSQEPIQAFGLAFPYLQIGFGQPSTCCRSIGSVRASSKQADANIVELGLVLLQLAAREIIPGTPQQGPRINAGARSLIEATLGRIETQFGDGLSIAIDACLRGESCGESELIRKTTGVLENLQDNFPGTA
jgi:hypothetical protein